MTSPTALLVIDMQLCAFDGKITAPINDGHILLDTVAELIDVCRSQKMPIIFAQTCAYYDQPYAKDMHGWEIQPSLTKEDEDEVVYKIQSNTFENTNLQQVLATLSVSKLITCGAWSEFCVANTTSAALALGYEATAIADAHGTVAKNNFEASEKIVRQNERFLEMKASVLTLSQLKAL
ncbi:MAG: nicotinamidase-related amidase [Flavobacterium sp.]|jgi:nicotinamidase-related amidase